MVWGSILAMIAAGFWRQRLLPEHVDEVRRVPQQSSNQKIDLCQ